MLPLPHTLNITFYFQVKRFTLPKISLLKPFITNIFSAEQTNLESLSYIFCSDKYLLDLNRQFLRHDDYTDILTFNLAPNNSPVNGECYISIDRVKENARLYNTTIKEELLRVIFHGALHLCGYNDKSRQQVLKIREQEDHYLQLFFSA